MHAAHCVREQRSGFGEGLFFDWRGQPDFLLDQPAYAGAEILVTGRNFGCGSSREHAPWAIEDFGYRAIIAPSFADIFRSNCTKIGLVPVELPESDVRELIEAATEGGATATVDLERQVVVIPGGREIRFEIDGGTKRRLIGGLDDIGITLGREDLIATYEARHERQGPVTTTVA